MATEMVAMTPEQRRAIESPCYLAIETALPRYAHRMDLGSLVLTVNSGYE